MKNKKRGLKDIEIIAICNLIFLFFFTLKFPLIIKDSPNIGFLYFLLILSSIIINIWLYNLKKWTKKN